MAIHAEQAVAIRRLAGIEEGGTIPKEMLERVMSIQERLRGVGATHLGVQFLAILVEFQTRDASQEPPTLKLSMEQEQTLRELAGLTDGERVPNELADRVASIQRRLNQFGEKLDPRYLAILTEFQMRPDNVVGQIAPKTPVLVEEDGKVLEGVMVRYGGGKDSGKVHVQMRGQAAGKYRKFPESVVRAASEVMA